MARVIMINAPMAHHSLFVRKKAINFVMHSVAASLKARGHSCRMINAVTRNLSIDQIALALAVDYWDLLVFPLVDGAAMINAIDLVRRVRSTTPSQRATTVFCGHAATVAYRELLQTFPSEVDIVVLGEEEAAICSLAESTSCSEAITGVAGIAIVRDGRVVCTQSRKPDSHLDALPAARSSHFGPVAVALSSRGCPFSCGFCNVNYYHDPGGTCAGWRALSAGQVVSDMVDLAERGVHFVEFIDPNFLGDRTGISRAIEVGSLLRQAALDVRFAFAARVDTLLAYREILPQLKQAGLIRIETGIEGADDESLRYFNKQTTRDMNRRCLQLLNELGIDAQIEFIMFRPETTSKHIEANLDLLREARALGFSIRKALYNILRLENGSRLTTKFLAEGKARKGAFFTYEYEFEDTITRDFYSALSEYYPKSGLAEYHAIARLRALIDGVSGPGAGDLRVHYSDCLHKSEELALSYFTAIWNSINAGNVEWRDQVKNIDESFDDSCSNVLRLTEDLQRIIEASPTGACFAD